MLRPEPGATATCEAARAAGLRPERMPLFAIEPVSWRAPDPRSFDGILLTSANATRHGGAELGKVRGLPVYAVGEATAAEARSAGLAVSSVGSGGVDSLLQTIDPTLRLLHLSGESRRDPSGPAQSITTIAVYRARAIADVPGLERIVGAVIAVHSPRAGARLAELAANARLCIGETAIAAISADAARSCGRGWQDVSVADQPDDGALLALAAALCNNSAA